MKLKKVTQNDPVERLAVSIKKSTMSRLDAYRAYYKATYGEEIEKSHLVEEILREFMSGDKAFDKFYTQGASASPGRVDETAADSAVSRASN